MSSSRKSIPSWWPEVSPSRQRHLPALMQQQGDILLHHRRMVNFSSNDYLGLRHHAEVVSAAVSSLQQDGLGSGASRYVTGDHPAFHRLEQELASWKGTEACLLAGSGMLANIGLMQAMAGRHTHVYADKLNHASLVDGVRLSGAVSHRYAHRDLQHLERLLNKHTSKQRIIVSDGVFSMDGDEADVAGLLSLAEQYDAWLVIDDAHGIGCIGPQGRGLVAQAGVQGHVRLIELGTFGKALGGYGACILATSSFIQALIQRLRTVIYSTAMPPSMAAAMSVSLRLLQDSALRQQLHDNIEYFLMLNSDIPLLPSNTPIQPLLIGGDVAALHAAEQLKGEGFFVAAIRPPTVPAGSARLRITISAIHSREDIESLSTALHRL